MHLAAKSNAFDFFQTSLDVTLLHVMLMQHALLLMVPISVPAMLDSLEMASHVQVINYCVCAMVISYCECALTPNKLYTFVSDINECLYARPCDPNAMCSDTIGSFTCTCNSGYFGDGLSCQSNT